MLWSKYVGGKLGTGVRYSSNLCFNTFPITDLNENQINDLNNSSFKIIEEREKYSELSISKLYNELMPISLKSAHEMNDKIVDSLLFDRETLSEEGKIAALLERYQKYSKYEKNELI